MDSSSQRRMDDAETLRLPPRAARQGREGREDATVKLDTSGIEPPPPGPESPPSAAGTLVAAQYEIVREIGRGGMSVVCLARDRKLGRFVAIKRLDEAVLKNARMRERFLREARSIAALKHPYIVQVYDLQEDERGPFFVMEYVAGPGTPGGAGLLPPALNLEDRVTGADGPYPPRVAVELVRKLCRATQYAHDRGMIHRDLKPSNILLDESGEPKIVDFGLARQMNLEEVKLTLTGSKLLSLGYGAPEQEADTSAVDARADIYALGGILYFCLTGENPRFFRESEIPMHLRPVLLKALEKNRDLRWPSAKDFEEALAQSEGPYLSVETDVGMWRCKWCNALNAMEVRYCAECGWDGLEGCPECGGETRVGVRFCAACGTDIKAFEHVRGMLERLREYRERKDFESLMDESEGVRHFQPKGEKGRALLRQVAELRDTSEWAMARKDELRQAIESDLEKENYEQVRDRLSEYDVLDKGDIFKELRVEMPWKIADRDIHRLRTDLNRARDLFDQKQLKPARGVLDEVRRGAARLPRLEVQFPVLKGRLIVEGPVTPGAPGGELADTFQAVMRDTGVLEGVLADAERRVAALTREAEEALKAQDYELCLRKGHEIHQVTVEPAPVDDVIRSAFALSAQIGNYLNSAEEALARGRFDVAERLCEGVTQRLKQDSVEARHLLRRVAWKRRVRFGWTLVVAAGCAAVVYLMSVCPVYKLAEKGVIRASPEALKGFYAPLIRLHDDNVLFRRSLELYQKCWGLEIFREPPRGERPGGARR